MDWCLGSRWWTGRLHGSYSTTPITIQSPSWLPASIARLKTPVRPSKKPNPIAEFLSRNKRPQGSKSGSGDGSGCCSTINHQPSIINLPRQWAPPPPSIALRSPWPDLKHTKSWYLSSLPANHITWSSVDTSTSDHGSSNHESLCCSKRQKGACGEVLQHRPRCSSRRSWPCSDLTPTAASVTVYFRPGSQRTGPSQQLDQGGDLPNTSDTSYGTRIRCCKSTDCIA